MSLIVGPTIWWIREQPPTDLGLQHFLFAQYFYFFWYEYSNDGVDFFIFGLNFDERDAFLFGY
jgi:hypothetical protein